MKDHLARFACIVAALLVVRASAAAEGGLSFEERVERQRAIERVYHEHRIWPRENSRPKPSLESVVSDEVIRGRVRDVLRKAEALESEWNAPVTEAELQAEINRITRQTRDGDMLRALFLALDSDPYLIAECLALPNVVDAKIRRMYESHPGPKPRAASFDAWWRTARDDYAPVRHAPRKIYTLAQISGSCALDSWLPIQPLRTRVLHLAVWTGSEMLVWGGRQDSTGDRYDPATDTWAPLSTLGAPSPRDYATAIWTGSEMVVWGGYKGGNPPTVYGDGARYDPVAEEWRPVNTADAPTARRSHTAIWTGTRMIVWGGSDASGGALLPTGGIYDPATDSWTPTSNNGAPLPRVRHTAVWTGAEMIVWGGTGRALNCSLCAPYPLNNGGRYNPATDQWTTMPASSSDRTSHSAVWTGTEMIVWGGVITLTGLNTGSRYNPATNSWTDTPTTGAPAGRAGHAVAWTGSEMIVWGGTSGSARLNTGGRYRPSTNSWLPTSLASAPLSRTDFAAVWSGTELIVWSGTTDSGNTTSGGRYNPSTNTWTATGGRFMPAARAAHTAVWTGAEMLVWGGRTVTNELFTTGYAYDAALDSWRQISSTGAPAARSGSSTIWTGTEMIIWGGMAAATGSSVNTGARYSPANDQWLPVAVADAPQDRSGHVAVWSGSEMLVWGGYRTAGGRYRPDSNTWLPIPESVSAPISGNPLVGFWTGSDLLVWSGTRGARYVPGASDWTAIDSNTLGRGGFGVAWTGSMLVVWSGYACADPPNCNNYYNLTATGARYDAASNTWSDTSVPDQVVERSDASAVWTGREVVFFGGVLAGNDSAAGGARYDPVRDRWQPLPAGAPNARSSHSAVWTGHSMIVWGGDVRQGGVSAVTDDGGRYCADTRSNPTADVGVSLGAAPTPAIVGGHLVYTITVTNAGPDTATGVQVTDVLDPSVLFVSAASRRATCRTPDGQSGGGTVTCTVSSMLANETVTIWLSVAPSGAGSIANSVNVTAGENDTNAANDAAALTTNCVEPSGDQPSISSFTPSSGRRGITVTVTGTNFTGTSLVKFNAAAAAFTVDSSTQITATVPDGATNGPISVTNAGGTATSSTSFMVLDDPAPTVSSIQPASGSIYGGTAVTVAGSGFRSGATLSIGGVKANITSLSPTQIVATTPSHQAGAASVVVATPNSANGVLANGFLYVVPPPANLQATAQSQARVALAWNAEGAGPFEVWRMAPGGTLQAIATVVGGVTTYADTTVTSGLVYLYKVRTVAGGGVSAYGNADLAATLAFTDDPIVAGATPVRRLHLLELRNAVASVRQLASLAAPTWAETIFAGVTPVRASHVTELRSALGSALSALGIAAPAYARPTLQAGAPIRSADLQELRNAVK